MEEISASEIEYLAETEAFYFSKQEELKRAVLVQGPYTNSSLTQTRGRKKYIINVLAVRNTMNIYCTII